MLKKIKDWLYYYFAEKNWGVRREYGPYVDAHQEEHRKHRWKHWWLLVRLNWHYRVLRKKTKLCVNENYCQNKSSSPLPYLDGSESKAFERNKSIHFAKKLLPYDVISFDIFDTLILRPFATPKDLFLVVGERLNILNFYNIRTQAEEYVRKSKQISKKNREVNIYDIYSEIFNITGLDPDKGVFTELQTEIDFCFTNPYMQQVYKMMIEAGKEIVFTSDMYIPGELMKRILLACGYNTFNKLYISCDFECSKGTGGLYQVLKKDYPNQRIIHIGDNINNDINKAKERGVSALYYYNCHSVGNKFRAPNMSELVGSFYSGLINTYLHNGVKTFSQEYEYGFIYGGIYVLGFCNWIHSKVEKEKIEKVIFLSRDGEIYKKTYDLLFPNANTQYFYWSRIINLKATIENSRIDFLNRVVTSRANLETPSTIEDLLLSMGLEKLLEAFEKENIKKDYLLLPERVEKIKQVFLNNWNQVEKIYSFNKLYAQNYVMESVGDFNKVALVDVGWSGTNVLGIRSIINSCFSRCQVKCYLAACHGAPKYNIAELESETIECYLFSPLKNRSNLNSFRNSNKGINGSIFEFFSQSNQPSFAGFSEEGGMLFDHPEINNIHINSEIQEGIIDFCKLYIQKTKCAPYLRNISGHDAFMPFNHITKDLRLIKNIFKNYVISTTVGTKKKVEQKELFSDMLNKKGIN